MKRIVLSLACSALLVSPANSRAQLRFDDVFEWVEVLVLEDHPEALNASPIVRPDPTGGWIVADRTENQVRIYDGNGRLIIYFGREGRGPGEFRHLVGAVRVASDSLVTVDSYGRVAVWTPDGALRREFTVPLRAVSSVTFHPPSSLVVISAPRFANGVDPAAGEGPLTAPVIHLVDIESEELGPAILALQIDASSVGAWSSVQGGSAQGDGDRYAVALPLSDTIWEFNAATHELMARTPIDHESLGHLARIPDGHADLAAFRAWIQSAYFIGYVAPAGAGSFFVALWGSQKDPRLLHVPAGSVDANEIVEAPPLHGFDAARRVYIFRDTSTLEPNRFRLARLKTK